MCVFCKIISGEFPSYKIYEDDLCIAILDISQATIGHTLIIPKNHVQNIFELSEELASELFKRVVFVANKLKKNLDINDLNILNNNGALAGQTVMHYHIHLLPRTENDNLKIEFKANSFSKEKMNSLLQLIIK